MFEQIRGHRVVTSQLEKELAERRLPSALLLFGNSFSGRMSTALEIARALSCLEAGEQSCTCSACRDHRILSYPYMMLLPQRDHNGEVSAAFDTLKRMKDSRSLTLFVRAVRTAIRCYHGAFQEVAPQSRRGDFPAAAEIDEQISYLLQMDVTVELEQILEGAKGILKLFGKLNGGETRALPVSYIRTIATWLHSTSTSGPRIVILEGADTMNEAAANSLLKILEEPPEGVYFILLAQQRHQMLPTILSRVRSYFLSDRTSEVEADVIKDIYSDNPQRYASLAVFFREKQGIDCTLVRSQAEDYLFTALGRRVLSHLHIQEIITYIAKEGLRPLFFQELTSLLEEEFSQGFVTGEKAEEIMRCVNEAMHTAQVFNQGDAIIMESLYYRVHDLL